jgi:hypothetical protein
MVEGYGRETGRRTKGLATVAGFRGRAKTPRGERLHANAVRIISGDWMSRRDASPFWSASAERQALKARRGETRKGLDAQFATRAKHAIAVSGHRPEMPLALLLLLLLLIRLQVTKVGAPLND